MVESLQQATLVQSNQSIACIACVNLLVRTSIGRCERQEWDLPLGASSPFLL